MSIIIRLQNLPWSARSADIRHFFGGLQIPDGGVHIIGGDKGDAFIAFNSDEDARLAMRKDGGKIKESYVKLLLSSHMEMQHVIEQVTKQPFPKPASPTRTASKGKQRSSEERSRKERSPDPKPRRRSPDSKSRRERSPDSKSRRERSPDSKSRRERSPDSKSRRERSPDSKSRRERSPARQHRDLSPRSSSSKSQYHSREEYGIRHRAQKRSRSRSPKRSSSPPMKKMDTTPQIMSTYSSNLIREQRSVGSVAETNEQFPSFQQGWKNEQQYDLQISVGLYDRRSPQQEQYFNESNKQTTFPFMSENRFSENMPVFQSSFHNKEGLDSGMNRDMNAGKPIEENAFFPNKSHGAPLYNMQYSESQLSSINSFQNRMHYDDRKIFPNSHPKSDVVSSFQQVKAPDGFYGDQKMLQSGDVHHSLPSSEQPFNRFGQPNLSLPPPPPFPVLPALTGESNREDMCLVQPNKPMFENYFIQIVGLDPRDNFRDVQAVLKGIYAPHNNIKWEVDNQNRRTNVVFVKISNKQDFMTVLKGNPYFLNDNKIEVFKCPEYCARNYFPLEYDRIKVDTSRLDGFCYMLKGLPFSVTYDDVSFFFREFRIADAFIIYEAQGKASGTGYVEFFDEVDFRSAMKMNGKKIAHRYIELLVSSKFDIKKARDRFGNKDDFKFIPDKPKTSPEYRAPQDQLSNKRPLCAVLTGLPTTTQPTEIFDFFEDSGLKPFAIHIMLNASHQPYGKCFAEFLNPLNFDSALKCHGKFIGRNIICVKQVLHNEMTKILDSQEASHHFESNQSRRTSSKPQLDLPEKVPYLWEPPDDDDDDVECDLSPNDNKNQLSGKKDKFEPYKEKSRFSHERDMYDNKLPTDFDTHRSNMLPRISPVFSQRKENFPMQQHQLSDFEDTKILKQEMPLDRHIKSEFSQEMPLERHIKSRFSQEMPFGMHIKGKFSEPEMPLGIDRRGEFSQQEMPLGRDWRSEFSQQEMPLGIDQRSEFSQQEIPFGMHIKNEPEMYSFPPHNRDNVRMDQRSEPAFKSFSRDPESLHFNQRTDFPLQHQDTRESISRFKPDRKDEKESHERNFSEPPGKSFGNQITDSLPSRYHETKENVNFFRPAKKDELAFERNFNQPPGRSFDNQIMDFTLPQHHETRENIGHLRTNKNDELGNERNFNQPLGRSFGNQMIDVQLPQHQKTSENIKHAKPYKKDELRNERNFHQPLGRSFGNQMIEAQLPHHGTRENIQHGKPYKKAELGNESNFNQPPERPFGNQIINLPPELQHDLNKVTTGNFRSNNLDFKEPKGSISNQAKTFPSPQHELLKVNMNIVKEEPVHEKKISGELQKQSDNNQMMCFPPWQHHKDLMRVNSTKSEHQERNINENIKVPNKSNTIRNFPLQHDLKIGNTSNVKKNEQAQFKKFSAESNMPNKNSQKMTLPLQQQPDLKRKDMDHVPLKTEVKAHQMKLNDTIALHVKSTSLSSDDSSRIPVKFEVKTKQPVATTGKTIEEAFGKEAAEHEVKKKLSRLSPEKRAESASSKTKDSVKTEKEETKSNKPVNVSPERNEASRYQKVLHESKKKGSRDPSPKREKDNSKRISSSSEKKVEKPIEIDRSKDRSSQSSRDTSKSNYQHLRDLERNTDRHQRGSNSRSRSNHRSESSRSSNLSRDQNKNARKEPSFSAYGSETLQLINVHPDIGLEEICDFFRNFDLQKDTIIRRYTDRGEPTGDVRVCFRNSRDAERAMKNLNRHYLGGIPVEMFLV